MNSTIVGSLFIFATCVLHQSLHRTPVIKRFMSQDVINITYDCISYRARLNVDWGNTSAFLCLVILTIISTKIISE